MDAFEELNVKNHLTSIKIQFGHDYEVYDHKYFSILSPFGEKQSNLLANYCTNLINQFYDFFDGLLEPAIRKKGILLFKNESDLSKYEADFLTEEDYTMPGGTYFFRDIPQFAFADDDYNAVESSLNYLYVIALLSHYDFPRWVEEALTQTYIQENNILLSGHEFDHTGLAAYRKEALTYFKENGLNNFWNGEIFDRSDSLSSYASVMAQMFMSSIFQEDKSTVKMFLADCEYEDHGNASLLKHFNFDLRDLSHTYLYEE